MVVGGVIHAPWYLQASDSCFTSPLVLRQTPSGCRSVAQTSTTASCSTRGLSGPPTPPLPLSADRTSALCEGGAPTCGAFQGNFAIDTPRLPIGYLTLDYGAPLLSAVGVVDLWDGVVYGNVTTTAGVLGFRVYGLMDWRATDALVVETETLSGSGAWNLTFVSSPAVSTWADANYVYNPAADCHGDAAAGTLLCTQLHLLNTSHSTAVQTRASGGGAAAQATYISISPVLPDAASSDAYAAAQVAAASQQGPAALLTATQAWWHDFWPAGAAITLNDTVLESFYYIQIYKFATATQRGRAVHDLEGPWYIDGASDPPLCRENGQCCGSGHRRHGALDDISRRHGLAGPALGPQPSADVLPSAHCEPPRHLDECVGGCSAATLLWVAPGVVHSRTVLCRAVQRSTTLSPPFSRASLSIRLPRGSLIPQRRRPARARAY